MQHIPEESRAFLESFRRGLAALGERCPAASPAALTRLAAHAALLDKWNATHNLTSVSGTEARAEALFLDAWTALAVAPPHASLIDVGAGGGFPGLVMLAAAPSTPALIFEKVEKKRAFLRIAAAELGYVNARVADEPFPPSRALLPPSPRLFVSRATWAPADWLARAIAIATPGDAVLVQAAQEALPAPPLGAALMAELSLMLPFSRARRRVASYLRV